MKLTDIYDSSSYLRAKDLEEGKEYKLTISGWELQEVDKETQEGKPYKAKQVVLMFEESDKKLGLNKTNAGIIATGLPDTDQFQGATIVLYRTKTSFGSSMVDCIRVRSASPAASGSKEPIELPGTPRHVAEPMETGETPF